MLDPTAHYLIKTRLVEKPEIASGEIPNMTTAQVFDEQSQPRRERMAFSLESSTFPIEELARLVEMVRRYAAISEYGVAGDGAPKPGWISSLIRRTILRARRFLTSRQQACN